MVGKTWRAAVVGASTLLGKELAEELNGATDALWDITLLDAEDAGGTVTAAGDEALVIQPIAADSFVGVDVVFFAGHPSTALEFWKIAHAAGASIVDLTGTLEGLSNVQVRSPFVPGGIAPSLTTAVEVPAHPAAIMLALAIERLGVLGIERIAATVLQPASELGNAGVDEMHQQTVSLLSFKPLQKNIYDAQAAFNLLASLGPGAKADIDKTSAAILRHVKILTRNDSGHSLTMQLLQAPVFHGYAASVFVETSQPIDEKTLRATIMDGQPHLLEDDSPTNETAAGKGEVLVRVSNVESSKGSAFWMWMAVDNLRLSARNAVACAVELVQLRPTAGVQ